MIKLHQTSNIATFLLEVARVIAPRSEQNQIKCATCWKELNWVTLSVEKRKASTSESILTQMEIDMSWWNQNSPSGYKTKHSISTDFKTFIEDINRVSKIIPLNVVYDFLQVFLENRSVYQRQILNMALFSTRVSCQ